MTNAPFPMTHSEGLSTLSDSPIHPTQPNPMDVLHRGMLCLIFGSQLEELLEVVQRHNASLPKSKKS